MNFTEIKNRAIAPILTIDKKAYGQMTTRKVVEIFDERSQSR